MSTIADLPDSFDPEEPLGNPTGNGAWSASYTSQDGQQTISWMGPFADRLAFVAAALFKPETIELAPGPPPITITRVVPLVCPYDDRLHCLRVDMRAFSAEDRVDPPDLPPWKAIVATLGFGVLPYATAGDSPFVSISEESTVASLTIPNHAYELVDDSDVYVQKVAQDIRRAVGQTRITIEWHEVVDLPAAMALIQPLLDKVNDAEVTLPDLGLVCAPGTLHIASRAARKTITFGSVVKSSLSMSLAYRPIEWNRQLASVNPFKGLFLNARPRPIESASFLPLIRGY